MPRPAHYTPATDMVDMTDEPPADEYVDPDTGERYGFRQGVAIKDLPDDQKAEYWRHKSRKHEARANATSDYDAIKAERDQLKAATMTDSEKTIADAVAAAVAKATADTTAKFQADIVRTRVEAALIARNVDADRASALVGPIDTSYFLAPNGEVDADKVSGYADGFKVGKPDPDTGQGKRGSSGQRSSVGAGRELYRELHAKK